MGNVMRSLLKKSVKPVKEYNLEARTEKILRYDKPTRAPYHPGTEQIFKNTHSAEIQKDLSEINTNLLKRLEQVYVTSHDPEKENSEKGLGKSSKPLPTSKEYVEEPSFGYYEPKRLTYGKTTLKNVLEFLSNHHQSPEEWNAAKIAETYKLDTKDAENVLKYFSTFVLVLPDEKSKLDNKKIGETSAQMLGAHSIVRLPSVTTKSFQKEETSS